MKKLFVLFLSLLLFSSAVVCNGETVWRIVSETNTILGDSFTEPILTRYNEEPHFNIKIGGDVGWEAVVTLQVLNNEDDNTGWQDVTTFNRDVEGTLILGADEEVMYRLVVKNGDYKSGNIFLSLTIN